MAEARCWVRKATAPSALNWEEMLQTPPPPKRVFPGRLGGGGRSLEEISWLAFLSIRHGEEGGEGASFLPSSENLRALRAHTTGKVETKTLSLLWLLNYKNELPLFWRHSQEACPG